MHDFDPIKYISDVIHNDSQPRLGDNGCHMVTGSMEIATYGALAFYAHKALEQRRQPMECFESSHYRAHNFNPTAPFFLSSFFFFF